MLAVKNSSTAMGSVTDPGPVDKSVLYDQENHVSSAVWEGQERGPLRCHEHTSLLESWKLTSKQVELIEKTGLKYLRLIPSFSLDNALISALVERWRRETNTFHLPVGEMTITLEDVGLILGLAIDGKPVITATSESPSATCESLLGKAPEDLNGGMLKLTWLKECFSKCPEDAPDEIVERYTRAYLLYLVGSTIFSTTTGNKVPIMYLSLFENFDEAGKFAWGPATLAILYRTLGNATFKSQGVISGSLTLLQCWSYYHLNIGQPKINEEGRGSFPLASRWKGKQSGPRTSSSLLAYRKSLDCLAPNDVQWLPYKELDLSVVPDYIKDNLDLKLSKTMLICCDKAERYLPDRCLRQFGVAQPIPGKVRRWEKKIRSLEEGVDLSNESDTEANEKLQSELKEWLDRRHRILEEVEGVDESDYMEWYEKITRVSVGRPETLESEFQRTVAAMKEIASLADSVAAEQIETRDKKLLDEIKSSVHNCLVDIVGEARKSAGRRKSTTKRKRADYYIKDNDDEDDERD